MTARKKGFDLNLTVAPGAPDLTPLGANNLAVVESLIAAVQEITRRTGRYVTIRRTVHIEFGGRKKEEER